MDFKKSYQYKTKGDNYHAKLQNNLQNAQASMKRQAEKEGDPHSHARYIEKGGRDRHVEEQGLRKKLERSKKALIHFNDSILLM